MKKAETKYSKFKLISIVLIFSILMQILMPTLLPLRSVAAVGDREDGYIETEFGKLIIESDATSLKPGDTVSIKIWIKGESKYGKNIAGIETYFDYDNNIFEPLQQENIELTPELANNIKWSFVSNVYYENNIGYYISIQENNTNLTGAKDFMVCNINLKVKTDADTGLLGDGTQVQIKYADITDVDSNNNSSDGNFYDCSLNLPVPAQAPTEYTVTYNKNLPTGVTNAEVTIPAEQKIAIGTSCTLGNATITAVGYTFAGWNTKADGTGTPYAQGVTYSDNTDLTLYAQWQEVKSTLIVDPNGGIWNGLSTQTPVAQRTFEQRIGTTKEIPDPTTVPQGNTIQYNANGGQVVYDNPTNITPQTVQTVTFAGWTGATLGGNNGKTYTYGTNNVTLTANYQANGIKLPNATKEGHNCIEWTMEKDGQTISVGAPGAIYTPQYDPNGVGKIILTAKYEKQSYQLTINAGNGTYNGVTPLNGKYEEEKTLSSVDGPTDGYRITLNWNDKATVEESTKIPKTQTKSLDRWEKTNGPGEIIESGEGNAKQYKFKFGAGNATITAVYKRDPIELEPPTRTGYTFDGWYTLPVGGTKIENSSAYMPKGNNETLYAHWTANTGTAYKVEHYKQNLDGNYPTTATETENKAETTGAPVTAVVKTDYKGYELDTTNTNNVLNGTVAADGSLVLKVYYKIKEYNVKFFDGETQIGQDVKVKHEQTLVGKFPTLAQKPGYTFDGWYDGETKITEQTKIIKDMTLKAKWIANTGIAYKVEHYKQNADGTYPTTATETENNTGTTGATVEAVIKTTYETDGYVQDTENPNKVLSGTIVADGSLVLKVYYKLKEYNIKFFDGDNKIGEDVKVKHKQTLAGKFPTLAEKPGYIFDGWYDGETKITDQTEIIKDMTLKAKWTLKADATYKVEHYKQNLDGTYPTTATETVELPGKTGATVSAEAKEYEGYVQDTENTNKVLSGTVVADGSLVLKVYYKVKEYNVKFFDGDNKIKEEIVKHKQTLAGKFPTLAEKTGYTFDGWYDGNTKITEETEIIKDMNLIAKWKPNEYKVTFKPGEGGTLPDDKKEKPISYEKPYGTLPTPEKPGYEFKDWVDKDGNPVKPDDIVKKPENTELTATWTVKTYTISYENLQGSDNSENPETYTVEDDDIVLKNLQNKENAKFEGWFDSQGNKVTSIDTSKLGNITVTAKWETSQVQKLYLKSPKYIVGEKDIDVYEAGDVYMDKIEPKTTVAQFIKNCDTNGEIKVIDQNGKVLGNDDLVGTGMTIEDTGFGEKITMTAVVMGDLDGNGLVTPTDLSAENQVILKIVKIEGAVFMASDLDDNDKSTVTDLSTINQTILKVLELTYDKKNVKK